MTVCTNCGHRFSARDALCDDWKDPQRSYGCPACGTFYVRDMNPPRLSPALIAGVAGGALTPPAIAMLANEFDDRGLFLITMASVLVAAAVGAGIVLWRSGRRKLELSPYRVTVEAGAKAHQHE